METLLCLGGELKKTRGTTQAQSCGNARWSLLFQNISFSLEGFGLLSQIMKSLQFLFQPEKCTFLKACSGFPQNNYFSQFA